MEKIICDVCKTNEATRKYRVKMKTKGCYEAFGEFPPFYNPNAWTKWVEVDICEECAKKILGLKNMGNR